MKIPFSSFRPVTAVLIICALTTAAASAAEDSKKFTSPEAERALTQMRPSFITIDFPGGTIATLNAAIAKSNGAHFNLIGEKAELAAEVPPFSLRNASPQTLAAALNQILNRRDLEVGPAGNMGGDGAVFVVTRKMRPEHVEPTAFESFQLGPNLEKQSIDDIVTAIRMAWELDPTHKADALKLKFHPPTKLLLASGSNAALQVARQVVASLPRDNEKPARESVPAKR